jgi:RimJ/RimL family protein N-acetyltransferase
LLRAWSDDDLPEFARMNADRRVMKFFQSTLTRDESNALAGRIRERWQRDGLGWWAVEVRGGAPFIGFVGLLVPSFEAHFTPCVEVGWRLAVEHWGRGYATEGAHAALEFGFEQRGLTEIVSFTAGINVPSIRVMERIGMRRNPADDFERTSIPSGHPLRPHVLYRLARADWNRSRSPAR